MTFENMAFEDMTRTQYFFHEFIIRVFPGRRMRSIMTLCFIFLFFSQLNLSQSLSRGESLILILNPEQPLLHTSSTKFLSFGISTSFLRNMDKLLISDEWFINLARHLSPAYIRIGGTAAECLFFNEICFYYQSLIH